MERLKAYYQDQGISSDTVNAVASLSPSHPLDFDQRVKAVAEFARMAESESLAAANKRISNILKKAETEIPPRLISPYSMKRKREHCLRRLALSKKLFNPYLPVVIIQRHFHHSQYYAKTWITSSIILW